ncbi:STY4528 family pathogenicity island replication protein [Pseudomonas sp. B35(2017)]|uniref:STY4528 family pathogenicity island replication protein n=1 Tax=Pseudomonas sp. B35(2017) TaxID=1981722 RepID=UPI000A1FCA95|nr:STY4528 family pathogenicity island replication protein [Pseudomonas sp. B35(2017)]
MAHPDFQQNSQTQDAQYTAVLALTLDVRLTPVDRNCWQVMRMLRSAGGLYPLSGMGQLRSYLTCAPLAKRAGFDTAWRAVAVLRLTGWISLVGQHCDPMTGNVLSVLFQVNDNALSFQEACALDPGLPELLQTCIDHKNSHLDRLSKHILATLERPSEILPAPTVAPINKDDDPPPSPPSKKRSAANGAHLSKHSESSPTVTQQTKRAPDKPHQPGSTYKPYSIKKERTYRARTREENESPSMPMALPACLNNAKADQQRDVMAALQRLPSQHRQDVLNELQARSQNGSVRNVVAYFFALVKRVMAGEFRLWAGRENTQSAYEPKTTPPTYPVRKDASKRPTPRPSQREVGQPYITNMRKILKGSPIAAELAMKMMDMQGWQSCPAEPLSADSLMI